MPKRINSRNKGKVGERELAEKLTAIFGVDCRRGQQFSGIEGQDVVGLPGVHVECKRVQSLNIEKATEQAKRDCADGTVPVVFHRKNNRPWLATVELDRLPELVTRLYLLMGSE